MINRMLCGLAALIGAVALTLGLTAGTASAEETGHYPAAGWEVRQHDGTGWAPAELSQITGPTTVELVKPAGEIGTSIETTNLGLEVSAGDTITVDYALTEGASSAAGAVRMFWYDSPSADTETQAPTQFVAAGADAGTLTITVGAEATVGSMGLTYDASNNSAGKATFSNLTVNGTLVLFQAPATPSPDPTETPDPDPATTPDPDPTDTPDPTPSATPDPVAGELPVTSGVRLLPALLIGGSLLLGLGAGLYYVTRRRVDPAR